MLSIGDKVRLAREAKMPALSQAQLAEASGVSRNKIAFWELNRSQPKTDDLKKVARILGVPIAWFYEDSEALPIGFSRRSDSLLPSPQSPTFNTPTAPAGDGNAHPVVGRRMFPILGNIHAAEFPGFEGEYDPEEFEEFSDDLYTDLVTRFFVRVMGDSMDDTWEAGDLALVHPQPGFTTAGYYVCVANHEGALLKILMVKGGRMYLVPENPEYEIVPIDGTWRMIGYVVGLKRIFGKRRYLEHGDHNGLRPRRRIMAEVTARFEAYLAEVASSVNN